MSDVVLRQKVGIPAGIDERVVDAGGDKWHTAIVGGAIDTAFSVSIDIEQQVIDLVDRYARRLSDIDASVRNLENRVNSHLVKMGFEL